MSLAAVQSIRRWTAVVTLSGCVAAARGESVGQAEHERDPTRQVPVYLGDLFALETPDARLVEALDRAIKIWRGCPQFGLGFPRLVTAARAVPAGLTASDRPQRTIEVELIRVRGANLRCGVYRGTSIELHLDAVSNLGYRFPCGALELNLAHEIGHLLGVGHDEPAGALDPQVIQPLMAPRIFRSARRARAVTPAECRAADRRWMTSLEMRQARTLGLTSHQGDFTRPLAELARDWHQEVRRIGLEAQATPDESHACPAPVRSGRKEDALAGR
jgi:hypothetical protein